MPSPSKMGLSEMTTRVVVVSFVSAILVSGSALPSRAQQEERSDPAISGTVTLNETDAQQGVRLLAREAESATDCGLAVVGPNAQYSMALFDPCTAVKDAVVYLAAAASSEDQGIAAEAGYSLEVPSGDATKDISYTGLTDEVLSVIAADAAAVGTIGSAGFGSTTEDTTVIDPRPPSLLNPGELYRLLIVVGSFTIALLLAMWMGLVKAFLKARKGAPRDKTPQDANSDGGESRRPGRRPNGKPHSNQYGTRRRAR